MVDSATASKIEEFILTELVRLLGREAVRPETSLRDLELDSLTLVGIILSVEDRFGVERGFGTDRLADLSAASTVGDLTDAVIWQTRSGRTTAAEQAATTEKLAAEGVIWSGRKPSAPAAVKLATSGKQAADYVAEGRS